VLSREDISCIPLIYIVEEERCWPLSHEGFFT